MRESILQILVRRDNMSESDAKDLIEEARDQMFTYLANDDMASAEDICSEYFGLEPDYIDELM